MLINGKEVSKEDLIYMAAFLDGEGSFYVNRNKIGVVCVNTYKPIIEWMVEKFGGSCCKGKVRSINHRQIYRWNIVANQAKNLCEQLLPYLKEKAPQASLLVDYQNLPRRLYRKTSEFKEAQSERERLEKVLKTMKHISW